MRYKFSKSYIAKMQALSKDKMILYTTEKASWRNFWLLLRNGKKMVERSHLVIAYKEYAQGIRNNYWYTEDGIWYDSSTRKSVARNKQLLFNSLPVNYTGLEIEIKTDK